MRIFIFLLIIYSSIVARENLLFFEDFNSLTNQKSFAVKILKKPNTSIIENIGPDNSDVLKVAYVGYPRGSERVTYKYKLSKKVKHAKLSYDVLFDEDFQWVKGGKLHGLGPQKPITGGKQREANSWSARVTFKTDGKVATYLYDQSIDKKYGIGKTSKASVFQKGRWHHVELEVLLNDEDQSNGFARITIDGNEIEFTKNIQFRKLTEADSLIQRFMFSTFHGGHKPKNAPKDKDGNYKTVYAYFDNFKVVEIID